MSVGLGKSTVIARRCAETRPIFPSERLKVASVDFQELWPSILPEANLE
jgi:hypothetical protein